MNPIQKFLLIVLLALALPGLASAQIDINHADAKTLAESMTGIGLVKAEAIIAYRNANGPFKRVDDLTKVKGIGEKTLDANRDDIVIVAPQGDTAQDADASDEAPPINAH